MADNAEIVPGVHRIDTPLGERFASLYLFVGSERTVLFDTGVAGVISSHLLPYCERARLDIGKIEVAVASHCDVDHFGGIRDVYSTLPAAVVTAHNRDADAMEDYAVFERERARSFRDVFDLDEDKEVLSWMRSVTGEGKVGWRVEGGEQVDLGDRAISILHTPGHSHGHLSIYDADNRFLAISDAILGDAVPLTSGEPAFPPTYRFVEDYLRTIEQVRGLGLEFLATAHYGVYQGEAVDGFLNTSRDFAQRLRASVLEAIAARSGGMTLTPLLEELNPVVGNWPAEGTMKALAFPVVGHIEQLADEGLIRVVPAAGGARLELV